MWIGSLEFDLVDREESKSMNQTLDRNVDRILFAFDLLDRGGIKASDHNVDRIA